MSTDSVVTDKVMVNNPTNVPKVKICLLYALAGGGHVSGAKALKASIEKLYPEAEVKMLDIINNYADPFFGNVHDADVKAIQYVPWLHEFFTKVICRSERANKVMQWFGMLTNSKNIEQAIKDHPADIYISTYPLYSTVFQNIKEKIRPTARFITVVTDIAFFMYPWANKDNDMLFLPTQEIFEHGKEYLTKLGMLDKVYVKGLPLMQKYFDAIDASLLDQSVKKRIIVMPGGDGYGKIFELIKFLDYGLNDIEIKIITGKNLELADKINAFEWKNKVIASGWIDDMIKEYLSADVVITKAGPHTIYECGILDVPQIIFKYTQGQEDGNVKFASKYGRSKYIPRFIDIIDFVEKVIKENGGDFRAAIPRGIPESDVFKKNWSDEIIKTIFEKYVIMQSEGELNKEIEHKYIDQLQYKVS